MSSLPQDIQRSTPGALRHADDADVGHLPWWRRHVDAIASVAATVLLVLVMPVGALSTIRRVWVFIGIALAVPTLVCVARAVVMRRQLARATTPDR